MADGVPGLTKKVESQHNTTFAEGGNTPMFGSGNREKTSDPAGPQTAGQTAADPKGSGGKFAEGGTNKMFGFAGSQKATAGITGAR